MSAPIQEPTEVRTTSGLSYGQRQLFRRPAPAGGAGDTHAWASISTDNVGFEHDGTDQWFDFYSVFISDSGFGTYFDFECDEGAGQFGDDRVFLTMLQSGLYTFTTQLQTSDLTGAGLPYDWRYQSRLCILGGAAGTGPCNGTTDRYPGQLAGTPLLQDREQLRISDNSGDDLWLNRSWTLPVMHPDPGEPYRTCELRFNYSNSTGSEYWFAGIWVVRHGDVDWGETNFDYGNATWKTGDPCTT